MATSPTSPTSFSSVVSAMSVSKARLKRKSTKRDIGTLSTDRRSVTSETFNVGDEKKRNGEESRLMEEPDEGLKTGLSTSSDQRQMEIEQSQINGGEKFLLAANDETQLINTLEEQRMLTPDRQKNTLLNAEETPVSGERPNDNAEDTPPVLCYINVSVDHAFPVKAKLLLAASLTIKVTFVNELSGLPIKKSSKEISAVSYYEKYQDLDFIMPIMTKPAIIDSDSKGTLLARWNEDMIFCELQQHLLEADHVVMLVELLVLPKVHQSPYPVAWGILIPSKVALDKLLPVQLYKVPKWKRRTIKSSDLIGIQSPTKYATLLYIRLTVSPIFPSAMAEPTLRSFNPTLPEVSQKKISMNPTRSRFRGSTESVDGGASFQWSRLPGQPCAVTDKLIGSLAGGNNGSSALAFSPSGRLLALACISSGDQAAINIYQVVSSAYDWQLVCSLYCSMGIVYECAWSHDETRLACASASGMCHVWTLADNCDEQLLPHPTYVYTIQWILESSMLISGCYDGAIRCWKDGKLIEVILTGGNRINTLCYDSTTSKVYSGTINGCISVWTVSTSTEESILQKDRMLAFQVIEKCSIQKLILIHGQQRLLVHATNGPYLIVDLRLDSIAASFQPNDPIHYPSALCVTPCGNNIITNNSSSVAYYWNSTNGMLVKRKKIRGIKWLMSAIAYHPFEHLTLFAALGTNQRTIMMGK